MLNPQTHEVHAADSKALPRIAVGRIQAEPKASSGTYLCQIPEGKETGLESIVGKRNSQEVKERPGVVHDQLTCFGTSEFGAVGCETRLLVEWILLCFLRGESHKTANVRTSSMEVPKAFIVNVTDAQYFPNTGVEDTTFSPESSCRRTKND